MDRDTTIAAIKAGLRARTGKEWSVTGGRGTDWGWIRISAPPRRRLDSQGRGVGELDGRGGVVDSENVYYMSSTDCTELGEALGLGRPSHVQGESIPAASDYYQEYIDRAEGRAPTKLGQRYWD